VRVLDAVPEPRADAPLELLIVDLLPTESAPSHGDHAVGTVLEVLHLAVDRPAPTADRVAGLVADEVPAQRATSWLHEEQQRRADGSAEGGADQEQHAPGGTAITTQCATVTPITTVGHGEPPSVCRRGATPRPRTRRRDLRLAPLEPWFDLPFP
jgi:hypothetical protein